MVRFLKYAVIFLICFISVSAQDVKTLMQIPLEELMKIEVTVASKKSENVYDAPGIITVITKEQIEGFAGLNLGQVLNRVVGASFLSANVFSDNLVQFRGQSLTPYNNHTLILLNGRPVRDPISGGLNSPVFASFPLDIIDHIEIIRGPGSVLYGSCAYSGVINIITEKPEEDLKKIKFTIGGGSYNTLFQNIKLVLNKNKFSLISGISHLDDNGPFYSFTGYEGVKGSANFDRKTFGFTTSINWGDFHLNSYYGRFYPYALSGGRNTWSDDDPHSNINQITYFVDLGYSRKVGEKLTVNANLTYNKHFLDLEDGNEMNAEDFLFEMSANITPFKKLNIISGVVLEKDNYWGDFFYAGNTFLSSVYIQTDYRFGRIKLISGLQYNKIENIKGNISPRFGLVSGITDKIGIKLLYSKAFRKAYPLETSFKHPLFNGNMNIKPELIRTAEVQIFYHSEHIQSSITCYRSRMSDIIYRKWIDDPASPIGESIKYYNAGTHDFAGVEIETQYCLMDGLCIIGSFYFQKNRNDKGIENASLHPNLMIKGGLLYHKNRFSAGIFNGYFGRPSEVELLNPDVDKCNPEAEAYNLLSVKISAEIFKGIRLSLTGDNLFNLDIRYPEYTSRGVNTLIPLYAGRVIWGSASINF
ncbi:hypothetical protein DRQ07_11245 [candidate division KSB1 bacterium]|nr:MAG: hypothetical protein DRQ07_11245 [candidate division KSB1 bacterium]